MRRSTRTIGSRHALGGLSAALAVCVLAGVSLVSPSEAAPAPVSTQGRASFPQPPVKHVFVINLENKSYKTTFGPHSKAPYLAKTLTGKGILLKQYYGTAHESLPNYVAQISGQAPDPETQADCQYFTDFHQTGTSPPQQAVGQGCVYPSSVRTVANQLQSHGLSWRGYMQSMHRACRHPKLNTADGTQKARKGDQYAARHNPFVYFHKIIDHRASCRRHDVGLRHLTTDLSSVSTTRNLSYITPNLCNDGHDSPCVDGRPGGLVTANRWLRRWVPKILASPAFKADGLLVIAFDEAEMGASDSAAACCGEGPGPNTPLPGITGLGGGLTGAVLVSPFITPGTTSANEYNHYSLLRTIEDIFSLSALGYAKQATPFSDDVWSSM
jgi:hypothetical protein